jgi:hypothetical protein
VRRACLRGDLVRLTAGRYLRREHWELLDPAARHVMLCLAAISRLGTPVVVSHGSAAAFWGLPRLGPWPARAHVTGTAARTSTRRCATVHAGSVSTNDVVYRYGALVTTAIRTAVDIAVSLPLRQAVVALDDGLRRALFSRDDLLRCLEGRSVDHGRSKATLAIGFADAAANRAGESLSRVVMYEGGMAAPALQVAFRSGGRKADVDFFWSDVGVVGEFDGETKYRDSERWSGLPPAEVVIREKRREDWLRALPEVRGFVRWTWRDAVTPGTLGRLLREAGVPGRGSPF